MLWRMLAVGLCVGLVLVWFVPKADAAEDHVTLSESSFTALGIELDVAERGTDSGAADSKPTSMRVQRAGPVSAAADSEAKDRGEQDFVLVRASAGPMGQPPKALKKGIVRQAGPVRVVRSAQQIPPGLMATRGSAASETGRTPNAPSLVDRGNMNALLSPNDSLKSVGSFPTGPEAGFSHLEIEVSHSAHIFRLYGHSFFGGKKELLHECKVGLGGPGFPTPVGQYFVTHIYDDDPWWIPPKDRAWAAGDSPSRRIYGGTMAPLLKKRDVRTKHEPGDPEDKISGPVKLEDYGYRFHGTNQPRSIGRNQSHGCVRMLPDDARKVANLIKESVGISERRESENGTFAVLSAPVRLNLIK